MKKNKYNYFFTFLLLITCVNGCDTKSSRNKNIIQSTNNTSKNIANIQYDNKKTIFTNNHYELADINNIKLKYNKTILKINDQYNDINIKNIKLTNILQFVNYANHLLLQGDIEQSLNVILSAMQESQIDQLSVLIGQNFMNICEAYCATMVKEGEENKIKLLSDEIDKMCNNIEKQLHNGISSDKMQCYIIMRQTQNKVLLYCNDNLDFNMEVLANTVSVINKIEREKRWNNDAINRFLYDIAWEVTRNNSKKNKTMSKENFQRLRKYVDAMSEDTIRPDFEELIAKGIKIPEPYIKSLLNKAINTLNRSK